MFNLSIFVTIFGIISFVIAQQCNNDYIIYENNEPIFTISANNKSCICKSFIGDGSNITNLNNNIIIKYLTDQINNQTVKNDYMNKIIENNTIQISNMLQMIEQQQQQITMLQQTILNNIPQLNTSNTYTATQTFLNGTTGYYFNYYGGIDVSINGTLMTASVFSMNRNVINIYTGSTGGYSFFVSVNASDIVNYIPFPDINYGFNFVLQNQGQNSLVFFHSNNIYLACYNGGSVIVNSNCVINSGSTRTGYIAKTSISSINIIFNQY
jgi:hypothetical protein